MIRDTTLKIYFALCLIWSASFAAAQPSGISFQNLSLRDGLSQNTIIRIFRDSRDYMWFCTRDGLNQYNGTGFEIFRNIAHDSTSISSSDITSIAETKDGHLWVGTHYGLNRMNPVTKKFTRYLPDDSQGSISDIIIKYLLVDSGGQLWVGTTSGLDLYDKQNDCFRHIISGEPIIWLIEDSFGNICFTDGKQLSFYNLKTKKITSYPCGEQNNIYHIYEDSRKNLWIGTRYSGLKRFDRSSHKFIPVNLGVNGGVNFNSEQIGYIVEDESRNLLLASRSGILVYNSTLDQCTGHIVQTGESGSLSDNTVITLYKDCNETVWVGTWVGGVDYYSHFSNYFRFHKARKEIAHPVYSYNSFTQWGDKIWIGTNEGLIEYDQNSEKYLFHSGKLPNSSRKNEVKYIKLIDNNSLYVSIFGGDIFQLGSQGVASKTIPQYTGAYLRDMEIDSVGNIWLASHTNDFLNLYNPTTKLLVDQFPVNDKRRKTQFVNVQDMLIDSDSLIWIGTRNSGLYQYNYKTYELEQYQVALQKGSLPNNNVSVLFKDSHNDLWIGTYGGGVCRFDRSKNQFEVFDERNGLNNMAICGILEDMQGNIWLTTQGGVSCLNRSEKIFVNYTHANGMPLQEINMHACMSSSDGTFFVGGSNGFVTFRPQNFKKNPYAPKIVISDFKIWNKPNGELNPMLLINSDAKISLKYDQSQFSISYAALNYIFPHTNQYAYKLEGFDKDWNYVGNVTTANYTNIPSGRYVFYVKGSNNDGVWSDSGVSFEIVVTPPFWATWWAYTIYAALCLLLLWFVMTYFITKERLENDLVIKQIEQQHLEENHQLRIRLFTNFSHELRTPLTLIIGPLTNLLSDSTLPSKIMEPLNLMQKNANRLLLLVNQLMDFRKLESGNLKLQVTKGDLRTFVNEIVIAFGELARQRNIKLSLNYEVDEPQLWYSSDQIEKVLFNLISNAFRHTRTNGEISITVRQWSRAAAVAKYGERFASLPDVANDFLEIKVRDTGHGIAAEELSKIFDPFYQAHNYEVNTVYGTGIGLNLTKGIVELHRGTIWAESKEGEGSIFRIFLPLSDRHLSQEQKVASDKNSGYDTMEFITPNLLSNVETEPVGSEEKKEPSKRYTILIIEDNQDVRFYIKSQLKNRFNIKEAEDGLSGKELALHTIPDLIICDVMMPAMNGIEVCKLLKGDIRTSHIPIILLTARVTISQIREGLEHEADDYITKPFSAELLQTRVENLILNRQKLREAFSKKIFIENAVQAEKPSMDESFLIKVRNYIMEHIDDPELSIENLADDIGMSRTQLYRKIKSITDMSPQKLLLSIRLKTAAACLKEEGLNVSETCARVGFSDPSYFSKRFKAFFNIAPSEYRDDTAQKSSEE